MITQICVELGRGTEIVLGNESRTHGDISQVPLNPIHLTPDPLKGVRAC